MATLAEHEQAMLRSQSGPLAGTLLAAAPSTWLTRVDSPPLQSAPLQAPPSPSPSLFTPVSMRPFLGRLWPPSRCAFESGGPGRRGFSVESVAARTCREGGARVATNLLVRDMDLRPPNVIDSRRLEVVADGLPLFGGVQLVVDTTLVSPLHCDGTARRHTAHVDGAVLEVARRKEEATYPELVAPRARARLVVWACEVIGRWSEETRAFLSLLAKAKARSSDAETCGTGRHGECVGAQCWLAQRLVLLPLPC